jgi:hypothetical protein
VLIPGRHWAVVVSGSIVMLIFWVLTPLQSAIFGSGQIVIEAPANFTVASRLMPVEKQAEELDSLLLNTAMTTKYYAQPFPPFTTAEYALLPLSVRDSSVSAAKAINWTVPTTKYSTDIECWPGKAEVSTFGPNTWHFLDNRGCNSSIHSITLSSQSRYSLLYMGYFPDAQAIDFLARPTCRGVENHFLAVMVGYNEVDPESPQMTVLFCKTSYWKQNVTVSVSVSGSPGSFVPDTDSIKVTSAAEPLSSDEFNSTGLEYLMGSGVSSVEKTRNFPATRLQTFVDRLNSTGLTSPVLPMVGFATAGSGFATTDFFNETLLEDLFRNVHKSMFALAFNRLQVSAPATNADEGVQGTRTFVLYGVKVSRPFSATVEGILVSVAISAIILHILCARAESKLTSDPASLGDLIRVVQNSDELVKDFAGKDGLEDMQLGQAFKKSEARFRLECSCQNPHGVMSIHISTTPRRGRSISDPRRDSDRNTTTTGCYRPVRPVALRKESGLAFITFLLGMLVGLIYLRIKERQLGGMCDQYLPNPFVLFLNSKMAC